MRTLLFFLIFALSIGSLFSQPDTLKAPHNGRIQAYMNHRIEVVGCNDYLEIYFYDKSMNPINNNFGVTGDAKFYTTDQVFTSSPFVNYGADGFTARIATPDFAYVRITATIAGQVVTAKFGNECRATLGKQ